MYMPTLIAIIDKYCLYPSKNKDQRGYTINRLFSWGLSFRKL